jgi:hypothetical protein
MRRFLSAPYWVHLIIDTIIGQVIWWAISTIMGTAILVKSIIAAVILVATIFAVAWYLPKLNHKKKTDTVISQTASLSEKEPPKVTTVRSTPASFKPFSHAHKCSKCGWDIRVTMFDTIATCPKCGNVGNL